MLTCRIEIGRRSLSLPRCTTKALAKYMPLLFFEGLSP